MNYLSVYVGVTLFSGGRPTPRPKGRHEKFMAAFFLWLNIGTTILIFS
jgi:hypothetical protein